MKNNFLVRVGTKTKNPKWVKASFKRMGFLPFAGSVAYFTLKSGEVLGFMDSKNIRPATKKARDTFFGVKSTRKIWNKS